MLVLLDACHSGGRAAEGRVAPADARALAATNVTIITSSGPAEASREDLAWQNGALTEAVLEALRGAGADEHHDGLPSATEPARYVDRRVRALTREAHNPALEVRSDTALFAVR